jgi:hypothetical protein
MATARSADVPGGSSGDDPILKLFVARPDRRSEFDARRFPAFRDLQIRKANFAYTTRRKFCKPQVGAAHIDSSRLAGKPHTRMKKLDGTVRPDTRFV